MDKAASEQGSNGLFDSDAFSPLDRILLRGIIDAVEEVTGAAPLDAMRAAIDELVALSSSRHRSRFHAAFLATLTGEPQRRRSSGLRDRAWERTGRILALCYLGSLETIADDYRNRREEHRDLLDSGEPCALVALPHLFRALFRSGDIADAAEAVPAHLLAKAEPAFRWDVLRHATDFLRQQAPTDARLLLDVLRGAEEQSPLAGSFRVELDRRHGQCLRAESHFLASRDVFTALLDKEQGIDRAEILADLGLAQAGFRGLPEVRIPKHEADVARFVEKLKLGEPAFRQALESPSARVTNAHLVLGILDLLEKRYDKARHHLERACHGAGERLDLYRKSQVYERIQCYYGFAIFLSLYDAGFAHATRLLSLAAQRIKPHQWPQWLVLQAIDTGVSLGGAECSPLIDLALRYFPALAEEFTHSEDLLARSEALRTALDRQARSRNRNPADRYKDNRCLLRQAIRDGNQQVAQEALDRLERLARENTALRQPFLDLLDDPANYEPIWSELDMMQAKAGILELEGRLESAAICLMDLFNRHMAEDEPEEAEEVLAMIRQFGLPPDRTASAEARMRAFLDSQPHNRSTDALSDRLRDGQRVHILFVGGNEAQARYDEEIRTLLKGKWPGLTVDFRHTGWSSNWGKDLDQLSSAMKMADAVVLMRFMRTMLGKRLRDRANDFDLPWRACTGHGRDFIFRSIEQAALAALGRQGT